jgi:acyl carrier protein
MRPGKTALPNVQDLERTKGVEEKLKALLVQDLGVPVEKASRVDSTTPLLGRGLGIDSMETLTLVAGIEREFGIQIEDRALSAELFSTLGTLSEFVLSRIQD